jgi:hypothetical protein
LAVLAVAVAIALPMFFMAFIRHEMYWAGPGIAVLVLSRALVPNGGGRVLAQL